MSMIRQSLPSDFLIVNTLQIWWPPSADGQIEMEQGSKSSKIWPSIFSEFNLEGTETIGLDSYKVLNIYIHMRNLNL